MTLGKGLDRETTGKLLYSDGNRVNTLRKVRVDALVMTSIELTQNSNQEHEMFSGEISA